MSKAYLNGVKDLVDSVVNSNYLNVVQGADQPLNLSVRLKRIKQGSVAIWRQLKWTFRVKHDLTICVNSWKHRLWEEYERVLVTTKELVFSEECDSLIVILKACHHKHGARLSLLRYQCFFATIRANIGQRLHVVCVHLSFKESFSEDLEKRFLWGKIYIVLALRPIET